VLVCLSAGKPYRFAQEAIDLCHVVGSGCSVVIWVRFGICAPVCAHHPDSKIQQKLVWLRLLVCLQDDNKHVHALWHSAAARSADLLSAYLCDLETYVLPTWLWLPLGLPSFLVFAGVAAAEAYL
jgi:hypothetical protein